MNSKMRPNAQTNETIRPGRMGPEQSQELSSKACAICQERTLNVEAICEGQRSPLRESRAWAIIDDELQMFRQCVQTTQLSTQLSTGYLPRRNVQRQRQFVQDEDPEHASGLLYSSRTYSECAGNLSKTEARE